MEYQSKFSIAEGIARAEIKDGRTIMLWHDLWDNNIRSSQFPELFSLMAS
jgi:hypothetical protein